MGFEPRRIQAGKTIDVQLEMLTERLHGAVTRSVIVNSNDPAQRALVVRVRAFVGAAEETQEDNSRQRD